jgi:hypothetical protein
VRRIERVYFILLENVVLTQSGRNLGSQDGRIAQRRRCPRWNCLVSRDMVLMRLLVTDMIISFFFLSSLDGLKGKNLIVGVPGAFTPPCSSHVP